MNRRATQGEPFPLPIDNRPLKLAPGMQGLLRCPVCHARLELSPTVAVCQRATCATRYPIIEGVPVLIHEANSIFTLADFTERRTTFFNLAPSWRSQLLDRISPSINRNVKSKANYRRLTELLLSDSPAPRVLVLGGSVLGVGMEALLERPAIALIESDISFGPRTALICDGHDIPLEDGSVDAVIAQAVLEHVVDPYRVVEEMHRVLRPGGLVYAETPFMQQMHGGRYDFVRFSYWGHRRLFRRFAEVDSGVVCGPGMALAWSYTYFLLSFVRARWARHAVRLFASLTSFFWKYFDGFLVDRPGALKAASGYFFLGRRSDTILSDHELVRGYKPELTEA
ncbi:MAG: methyltransferase type 11 [Chloroflexi bacterium HGW-Chloroflexi-1]|nr:MAG: methyltransferase type 11 [Chloroflexi bacterium HGW-Chloroflexi-1]